MKRAITDTLLRRTTCQPRPKPFEISDTTLRGFTLRIQPSGVRTFVLRRGQSGRVTLGRVGELTALTARNLAVAVLNNLNNDLPPWTGLRSGGESIGDFADGPYATWRRANRRNPEDDLKRLRNVFARWWKLPLGQLTPEMIERWKNARLAEVSRATMQRDLDCLSGLYTRAIKTFRKPIPHPVREVERVKLDRRPKIRYLSAAEEKRLRAAMSERDKERIAARESGNGWRLERHRRALPRLRLYGDHLTPAVLVSMNTGLRFSELTGITWADVDLRQKMLTVPASITKTQQSRHVPLNSEAASALRNWKKQAGDSQRVFPIDTSFKTAWKALLSRAEISGLRWHDLRHHFASRLVQKGVPLNTVRDLGGWQSYEMVLRYAHLAPDERRKAVSTLMEARP